MINAENLHKWIAFGAMILVGLEYASVQTGILLILWFLLVEAWSINSKLEDDAD